MTAVIFDIISRTRAHGAEIAALSQFALGPGTEVDPHILLTAPGWSLYAFDLDAGAAVFTELPAGTDLGFAPFVYQAQFEAARRLATLPLDEFEALAESVPLPEKLVFIFSTGRAGSTLASRILAQVPGVWSLSEPDAFSNLALARFRLDEDRIARLISAATRIIARQSNGAPHEIVAIKPRSEATLQIPLYALALPQQTRFAFLYRDAEGYSNSIFRYAQRLFDPKTFANPESWKIVWPIMAVGAPYDILDEWFTEDRAGFGYVDLFTLAWKLRMEGYLGALDAGAQLVPIHYSDLNAERSAQTLRLLRACGIDTRHLEAALRAFDRDAQEGAVGSEVRIDRPLNGAERARIAAHLRRWNWSDYRDERLQEAAAG